MQWKIILKPCFFPSLPTPASLPDSWKGLTWIMDLNTEPVHQTVQYRSAGGNIYQSTLTRAHFTHFPHFLFFPCTSFAYCKTFADWKMKKTKFCFCSTEGPGLHVQLGPKANKRNRWHPSKGNHSGHITLYQLTQALLHNKWLAQ